MTNSVCVVRVRHDNVALRVLYGVFNATVPLADRFPACGRPHVVVDVDKSLIIGVELAASAGGSVQVFEKRGCLGNAIFIFRPFVEVVAFATVAITIVFHPNTVQKNPKTLISQDRDRSNFLVIYVRGIDFFSFWKTMTRWDCDVKLWRGVPASFPAFHGWPVLDTRNTVLSSTASVRYICCHACHKWVSQSSPDHLCTPGEGLVLTNAAVSETVTCPEPEPDRRVYVISTEDNSETQSCSICKDRMHLDFIHDIEEWVFMDCVYHNGRIVHEFCRNTAFSIN